MYVCILLCIHYLKTLVLRTSVLIRLKISLTLICCKNDVVRSTFIFVHFSCLMEQCMWHWPRPDEQKVCFYCCVFNFEPFDCVGRSLRSYFCLAVFFSKCSTIISIRGLSIIIYLLCLLFFLRKIAGTMMHHSTDVDAGKKGGMLRL